MTVNTSSPNEFKPNPNTSYSLCVYVHPNSIMIPSSNLLFVFILLPLFIFILHRGLQHWRAKHSSSSALSHSDCFTYNMVFMELFGVSGNLGYFCAILAKKESIYEISMKLLNFTLYGQVWFHLLTCVERYLAVIHPIIYLNLKNQKGAQIRNAIIAVVWLFSVTVVLFEPLYLDVSFLVVTLVVVDYCSLSVLFALIRPGPGEQGRNRGRVDPSKMKAFYTIVVILGVLVIRFSWDLFMVIDFEVFNNCVIEICHMWFELPSRLVLPLLFLHRQRRLTCR